MTYHLGDKVCLHERVFTGEERKGEGGMHEKVERAKGVKRGMPEWEERVASEGWEGSHT